MRVLLVRQGFLVGICALVVSGCSYPHAGPELPAGATSAEVAPTTPPSVLASPHSVPAASPSYPTGHPSLRPSTANAQTVSTATARPSATNPSSSKSASSTPPTALEPVVPTATLPLVRPVPDPSDVAPRTDRTDIGSTFDNLEITDDSLKGKLAILRVGSEPSANDLLSVFAGLKNRTSSSLAIEVQTLYKDKLGNSLNAGSWIPMTLKPHEETEYRSTSISADAVDFLVRVRRAPGVGSSENN